MYNIVRHLVEGREGIETFNLSKTEHLNAYANQIRTSSFSVCCVFAVCMCVCLLFPQLWLWFRLLLFSFSFSSSHSVRVRVHVRARVLRQLDTRSSPSSSSLLVPFPSRVFSILFYFSVASFVHFKLQFSSVVFLYFIFVLCFCLYCGILANNFTTAWVHKTSVEFDGWVLFNAAGGRAQGLLFLPV